VLLGWVATLYLLAAAVFLLPFGRLADIYGRKKVFVWGVVLFTGASLLLAFSGSLPILLALRVVQGAGSAMIFGTGTAILTSVFAPGERGRALGINVAAVYVGLSVGPFLGGFLTQQFGWRSIFLAVVPLGLLILGVIAWKLEGEWAGARGEPFDAPGSAIYGLALVALMYGLSRLPELLGLWLILAGLGGGVAFVLWERRVDHPVLDVRLFRRNRTFAFSGLAALINYSATFAIGFLMSLYLQYIKGLTPQTAGLVLIAQPVMQALFSPLAGWLSDRMEPRIVASLGMALTAAGLTLFAFLGDHTLLPFIVGSLMLLGLGFALFSSPNTNAIMSSVERRFYGVASATVGTMRLIGQMFSMGVATLIFALYLGRVEIGPGNYGLFIKSVRTAFAVFATLCFGGIFASLARGRVRGGPTPDSGKVS
jgi:EmrB/QacA subfamily drug resistance transporter